jgi:N-methylhydantoinase B
VHVPASPWLERLPQKWRIETAGRVDAEGFEVEPINTREIIEKLRALPCPPESIAICLLFSPLNPFHEQEIASTLAIEFPNASIACSNKIFPHLGEYERTLATVKSLGLEVPQELTTSPVSGKNSADRLALQLEKIANCMQQKILDAAVSSVVREAMDCAAALFLPDGRMIAQARTLPLLSGSLSPAVKGLLRAFPIEFMEEGDGYLANDPWSGGTHLPDFVLLRPIFGKATSKHWRFAYCTTKMWGAFHQVQCQHMPPAFTRKVSAFRQCVCTTVIDWMNASWGSFAPTVGCLKI